MQARSSERLSGVLTIVIACCAIVSTLVVIRREFFAPATAGVAAQAPEKPSRVNEWGKVLSTGTRVGSAGARVQIVEFADFQCPYCVRFDQFASQWRKKHESDVSITFVHYPLPSHPFAEPAALAAECATAQNRFAEMKAELFKSQDLIAKQAWRELAGRAGVPLLDEFEQCLSHPAAIEMIAQHKALGDAIGVAGTPTVLINGWKLSVPPNEAELDRIVVAVAEGKAPFGET